MYFEVSQCGFFFVAIDARCCDLVIADHLRVEVIFLAMENKTSSTLVVFLGGMCPFFGK